MTIADGPLLKLRRAGRFRAELDELVNRHFDKVEIDAVELSKDGRITTWKVRFKPLPDDIPGTIGDLIHNLRSALDQQICAIARRRGLDDEHFAFPFSKDAESINKEIKNRRVDSLGPEAVRLIAALKPYPGGNELLYGLHRLDIADKHRLIIPVQQAVTTPVNFGGMINDMQRAAGEPVTSILFVTLGDPYLLTVSDGEVISRPPGQSPLSGLQEGGALMSLVLPAAAGYLVGRPLMQLLDELARVTQDTVNQLQALVEI